MCIFCENRDDVVVVAAVVVVVVALKNVPYVYVLGTPQQQRRFRDLSPYPAYYEICNSLVIWGILGRGIMAAHCVVDYPHEA